MKRFDEISTHYGICGVKRDKRVGYEQWRNLPFEMFENFFNFHRQL